MITVIMLGAVGNKKMGNSIAKSIIKAKLSPCVYLQKVNSISKNGAGQETIAIIKTNDKNVKQILDIIQVYKVPEFLVFKTSDGWIPYLNFLETYK